LRFPSILALSNTDNISFHDPIVFLLRFLYASLILILLGTLLESPSLLIACFNFKNAVIVEILSRLESESIKGICSIINWEKDPISSIPSLISFCHPLAKFTFFLLIEYLYLT
jgi:hypothetical protein